MPKKKDDRQTKDKIIDSALDIATDLPWQDVSFNEIIEGANVPMIDAQEYFDCKTDILVGYGRRIDKKMIENVRFPEGNDLTIREKLFDIMMERFDIVNNDRDAVLSIVHSFRSDPKQMIISLPHLGKSMGKMLTLADADTVGILGAAQISGLMGAYLYALKAWKNDESDDLGSTMAALDKALNIAEQTANSTIGSNLLSFLHRREKI